jgi:hypothetical protein
MDMAGQAQEPVDNQPRYQGEDSRLTSRKELAGWYSYGWAAEVFAVCAMGIHKASSYKSRTRSLTTRSLLPAHHTRAAGSRSRSPASRQIPVLLVDLEFICCHCY